MPKKKRPEGWGSWQRFIKQEYQKKEHEVRVKKAIELNLLDIKILRLLKDAGSKGILQSELWKRIGIDSKEISRIATRLEELGVICREKELLRSRWTYRLYINKINATLMHLKHKPKHLIMWNVKCETEPIIELVKVKPPSTEIEKDIAKLIRVSGGKMLFSSLEENLVFGNYEYDSDIFKLLENMLIKGLIKII